MLPEGDCQLTPLLCDHVWLSKWDVGRRGKGGSDSMGLELVDPCIEALAKPRLCFGISEPFTSRGVTKFPAELQQNTLQASSNFLSHVGHEQGQAPGDSRVM